MSGGRRGELAESDDGAAAAAPLGVVRHVHPVVGAIDVVDAGLALVPVLHFREGDQLDGLALRKQLAGKASVSSLSRRGAVGSSLPPVGCSACSGVGILAAIYLSSCISHCVPTCAVSSGPNPTL